jgi:vacuolar-type H+-ATPase subunit H
MEKTVSPLQIIHEKEAELQRRLEEVRRQAEVKIQSAYAEAKQTIARGGQKLKLYISRGLNRLDKRLRLS